MPLPTMSLRAAPEHHQLIRDIATALRTRPELADVLRDVLQSQYGGIAQRDTDVLHAFQERLTIQSEGLQKIRAFAENIDKHTQKRHEKEAGVLQDSRIPSRRDGISFEALLSKLRRVLGKHICRGGLEECECHDAPKRPWHLQHFLKIEGFVLFGEFLTSGRVGDGRVAGRAVAN